MHADRTTAHRLGLRQPAAGLTRATKGRDALPATVVAALWRGLRTVCGNAWRCVWRSLCVAKGRGAPSEPDPQAEAARGVHVAEEARPEADDQRVRLEGAR
eukprot:365575-Chlamydomonas_euryale.AAC.3